MEGATEINIHVYMHGGPPDLQATILAAVNQIKKDLIIMSGTLDTLTAQVASTDTVMASAVVLIQGIAARIAAAGTDPVALAAIVTDLKGNTDSLAAAVAADGTPPAPTA